MSQKPTPSAVTVALPLPDPSLMFESAHPLVEVKVTGCPEAPPVAEMANELP